MNREESPKRRTLTLIESMIVTVIVAGLLMAFYPGMLRAKARSQRISCVCHEKQLGIAFRGFGIDHGGFPMQATLTNAPVEQPRQ